ncbi:MAG: chloride channel protein [Ilumatobacteraceae bacterium]
MNDQRVPSIDALRPILKRSREVVLLAALTGVVTGYVVAVFDWLVVDQFFDRVLSMPLWAQAIMPIIGLIIAAFARFVIGSGASPATADEYLHAFHETGYRLTGRVAISRGIAALATLGTGGAMGLEGPSIYFGSASGSVLQRRLPRVFKGSDHRTLLVAGAAAGVAAIFKTPATGAVFALEVPYRDDLARRMLLPALVASASGYLAFASVHGVSPLIRVAGSPDFVFRDLAGAVLVGLVAGIGAKLFAWLILKAKKWADRPITMRLAVAAPTIVAMFVLGRILTGESLMLGSGYAVVQWSGEGGHAEWLLLAILVARSVTTASVLAGAGTGGLFIPLVVNGALLGRVIGDLVNTPDPGLFTVVGIAAFLGAGYRVPLASVMFVAEATGRPGFIVPGLLAAVAAELVVGNSSVTPYQRSTIRETLGHNERPAARNVQQ